MPQNDADRIARQRAQQQQGQAEEVRLKEDSARQSLIQQIETEIAITLRWLANHDYPGIVEVSFPSDNRIKEWAGRRDVKGAWLIKIDYPFGDSPSDAYLLSDGRIVQLPMRPLSPRTYFDLRSEYTPWLQQYLDGIRKLRS